MRSLLFTLPLLVLLGCERRATVEQPIDFSHRLHVEKGLACGLCHASTEKASFAGLPATADCMICHQSAITQSQEEEKVRAYAARTEEIPWRRVTRVPPHVFFSHRRHVALGGIACADCHGAVAEAAVALTTAAVSLDMASCMGCHAQRGASNDCNACHR
jgi:hypothetical protein